MKILIVHNAYVHRGGEDVCVEREQMALREGGMTVESFIVRNTSGLETMANALKAPWGLGLERHLEKLVNRFRPQVIHAHNLFPTLSPRVFKAAKQMGVRVILTLHNYRPLCLNGLFRTPSGERCERCAPGSYIPGIVRGCYRGSRVQSTGMAAHLSYARHEAWYTDVDAFIAPCQFLKKRFLNYGWTDEQRIHVQSHFLPTVPSSPIKEPERYVLYLGRLSEEKGVRWLLNVFKNPSDLTLKLVIAGDGPLRAIVEKMVGPRILYLGPVDEEDKARWLSTAYALLLPSLCYENFPLAALEANAWGVPLLVSRLGGLAELVESGINGDAFEAGNVLDFHAKLRAMTRWESAMARTACRQFVNDHFSKKLFLKKRLGLYEKVCA